MCTLTFNTKTPLIKSRHSTSESLQALKKDRNTKVLFHFASRNWSQSKHEFRNIFGSLLPVCLGLLKLSCSEAENNDQSWACKVRRFLWKTKETRNAEPSAQICRCMAVLIEFVLILRFSCPRQALFTEMGQL